MTTYDVSRVHQGIEEIAQMVWETLFSLRLDRGGQAGEPPGVTSVVQIDGAWDGAVMVSCPMVLAVALAEAMFGTATEGGPEMLGDADVRDALGEVANIVAGNVKALLPQPCHTSLATVALGTDYELSVPGTHILQEVPFTCVGHGLVITLLERKPARAVVR